MDWHPVISVQQQTPDDDFCHFSISKIRFAFWAFFRKPERLGSHTGSKWWPGDPVTRTWKMTHWPNHWPGDPITQFHVWCLRDYDLVVAHCLIVVLVRPNFYSAGFRPPISEVRPWPLSVLPIHGEIDRVCVRCEAMKRDYSKEHFVWILENLFLATGWW